MTANEKNIDRSPEQWQTIQNVRSTIGGTSHFYEEPREKKSFWSGSTNHWRGLEKPLLKTGLGLQWRRKTREHGPLKWSEILTPCLLQVQGLKYQQRAFEPAKTEESQPAEPGDGAKES